MNKTSLTLGEISTILGAELRGDPGVVITGLATLQGARAGQLGFLANQGYARYLPDTQASGVILMEEFAARSPTNVVLMANPYLGYARLSHYFSREPAVTPGVHPTAIVDPSARVSPSASIAPHVVIGEDAEIGEFVTIGAGAVVGARCIVGENTRLHAGCTLYHDVQVGARCVIHANAVIGSDGFGFASHNGEFIKIAQLGGVRLGNDVEIGANTSIDRGALEDTVLGDGVKVDNQVQIAHNVVIGDHSALAGCVGIAGSTTIGRYCQIGGGAGIAGHISITDGVHLTGMAMVTNDITEPGVYSSGTGIETNKKWLRNVVRFRQLDSMARKLKKLEGRLDRQSDPSQQQSPRTDVPD